MKPVSILRKPLQLAAFVLAGYFTTPSSNALSAPFGIATHDNSSLIHQNTPLPIHASYFPRPASLTDAVSFWRQVFGEWKAHQLALHDDKHLGIVYELVEISGYIGGKLSPEQQAKVDQRKKWLSEQLNDMEYRLHKRIALTTEQQGYYKLIVRNAGRKAIHDASQRIRIQRGMKESFLTGLKASSRYDALIRRVLKKNHLPEVLAFIPHVESAFTTTARSPAGAIGVWQFMPVTGKRFLRIDKAVDERYDPILATEGASKYLAHAYNILGNWGLAVTAYNYGLSGMSRARRELGSDIARIVKQYDGVSFGFASRNYYAEFLAVCDIMANLPRYFPEGVNYQAPPVLKQVIIPHDMTAGEIAKKYHIHYTTLASLNPAWTKEAADGLIPLPAQSAVWLPSIDFGEHALHTAMNRPPAKFDFGAYFLTQLESNRLKWNLLGTFPNGLSGQLIAEAPTNQPSTQPIQLAKAAKPKPPKPAHSKSNVIHIVQSGDSPYTIASKYSVHLRELMTVNEMEAGGMIRPGQSLLIPEKIDG